MIMRLAKRLAVLFFIFLISCQGAEDDGMVHFGTFQHEKYFRITVKYLKESTTIQGYPCKRGKVRFHFNDSLMSFRSTDEISLDHGSIPAGSRFYMYYTGTPEYILLSAGTEIQGYKISSRNSMLQCQLRFYNGGELWRFRPAADVEIDGIHCSHKQAVELYPDGSLMSCFLARDVQGMDHHFPAGSRILMSEEGIMQPYSFPIQMAITRLMNIDEYFSEPIVYAYHKRMEGKVDSSRKILRPLQNEYYNNPMYHYELARIKRHRMAGDADEKLNNFLFSASHTWVDPYNVIMAFFHAESMLFAEKNKGKLKEEDRHDNFYFSAIDGFEKVLEMKPDYHAARLHLVDIYSHLPGDLGGDSEKAKMHTRELLKYDTVWAARAEAILLSENEGLLDFWLGVGEKHGNDPLLLQELGRAYLVEGDAQNAETCFRKAMEVDPSMCALLIDLACYQMKQVRTDKTRASEHSSLAESYLLEYTGTDPVNPHQAWCYAKLAWLKDLAGETAEGTMLLEKAKRLDSRFSREEAPPSMLLFIPLGEVFDEFESYFRP